MISKDPSLIKIHQSILLKRKAVVTMIQRFSKIHANDRPKKVTAHAIFQVQQDKLKTFSQHLVTQ